MSAHLMGADMLRGFSTLTCLFLAGCAPLGPGPDGGIGDAGPAAPEGPSDLFFRGVGAGEDAAGDDLPAQFIIVLFEPALAELREDGAFGADPTAHDAAGTLYLPDDVEVRLVGSFDDDGYHLEGDGWIIDGFVVDGSSTTGTFAGPAGQTGNFAGEDTAQDRVATFCGGFDDNDVTPGLWNLTVSSTGRVSGVWQTGGTHGFLEGTATGTEINLEYVGDCSGGSVEDPCTATGTATGTIDENGTMTGSFSGTHSCPDIDCFGEDSGTFVVEAGTGACPGGDAVPEDLPTDEACGCVLNTCNACGLCCYT